MDETGTARLFKQERDIEEIRAIFAELAHGGLAVFLQLPVTVLPFIAAARTTNSDHSR